MTAAGEAVLAVAYGEVGYVEGPNNSTKYWDWYGGNYGPWCGVFCMWCSDQAGYPVCSDTVLVSNGTWHGYTTGGSGATGVEAQRTLDLQPGDFVLFSWEPWEFRDGVPTCVGEWDGYTAGDHIGIYAYDLGGGRFAAVEGNTSDGSWDNGGMVLLREDRYTSQVCGWWRQEHIAGGDSTPPPPKPTYNLTELGMFLLENQRRGIWLMGPGYAKGLNPEEYSQAANIPGIGTYYTGDNERAFDLLYGICMGGGMASES